MLELGWCIPSGITGQFMPCSTVCRYSMRSFEARQVAEAKAASDGYVYPTLTQVNQNLKDNPEFQQEIIKEGHVSIELMKKEGIPCANGFTE